MTDSAGNYTMELASHGYVVEFQGEPLGYGRQWFDHADHWWLRETLDIGSDPISGIDAEMKPLGRIEGVVKEEGTGDPVENARVCAWAQALATKDHCTSTDNSGGYSMTDVQPGPYKVEFWPRSNQLWQAYDHREDWQEADVVSVDLSEVVTGVDADVPPGAGVEGTVLRADTGNPFLEAWVKVVPVNGEDTFWLAGREGDGTYSRVGLPPGEYKIEFLPMSPVWQTQYWDHKQTMEEATPISLAAGTITSGIDADIVLTPKPDSSSVSDAPTSLIASAPLAPVLSSPPFKNRLCPKGYRAKRVSGKRRCVRRHKHHKHRRHR